MQERYLELTHSVRSLCEILREDPSMYDLNPDLSDLVDEIEEQLDELAAATDDDTLD